MKTTINPKKTKYLFIKLDYPIKEAKALTRTTIALYEAVLWFQRKNADCYPGYKKLMERAKIDSKTTISLHLKVLIKVGLVKKTRRGKKQSNIYCAQGLDNRILQDLRRPYQAILDEIAKDDERARKVRQAKKELGELRSKKCDCIQRKKTSPERCFPQKSEVQLMDSKEAFHASNILSSNRNNDSTMKKSERGGGVKLLGDLLRTPKNLAKLKPLSLQIKVRSSQVDKSTTPKVEAPGKSSQPLVGHPQIRAVSVQISSKIGDQSHEKENAQQAVSIYSRLEEKGVSEADFVDVLYTVAGLTNEVRENLERPGAYFFAVLRDRYKLQGSGSLGKRSIYKRVEQFDKST